MNKVVLYPQHSTIIVNPLHYDLLYSHPSGYSSLQYTVIRIHPPLVLTQNNIQFSLAFLLHQIPRNNTPSHAFLLPWYLPPTTSPLMNNHNTILCHYHCTLYYNIISTHTRHHATQVQTTMSGITVAVNEPTIHLQCVCLNLIKSTLVITPLSFYYILPPPHCIYILLVYKRLYFQHKLCTHMKSLRHWLQSIQSKLSRLLRYVYKLIWEFL